MHRFFLLRLRTSWHSGQHHKSHHVSKNQHTKVIFLQIWHSPCSSQVAQRRLVVARLAFQFVSQSLKNHANQSTPNILINSHDIFMFCLLHSDLASSRNKLLRKLANIRRNWHNGRSREWKPNKRKGNRHRCGSDWVNTSLWTYAFS